MLSILFLTTLPFYINIFANICIHTPKVHWPISQNNKTKIISLQICTKLYARNSKTLRLLQSHSQKKKLKWKKTTINLIILHRNINKVREHALNRLCQLIDLLIFIKAGKSNKVAYILFGFKFFIIFFIQNFPTLG